jgi:DNA polymerase III epsilon subunit-like protein
MNSNMTVEEMMNGLSGIRPRMNKKRIMVFDVETTGLLPKSHRGGGFPPLSECPHIIQLSFIIYDVLVGSIVSVFDTYIDVDPSVEITSFITELTGGTRAKCAAGMKMSDALVIFHREYRKCDCIVAHNIEFDKTMIGIEMSRNEAILTKVDPEHFVVFNDMYNRINNIEMYCTMKAGKDVCNIVVPGHEKVDANGLVYITRPYKKYPKLAELYRALFGEEPENLHNSLVDTYICLKCFYMLKVPRVPKMMSPV